jgi:hypothetical protein
MKSHTRVLPAPTAPRAAARCSGARPSLSLDSSNGITMKRIKESSMDRSTESNIETNRSQVRRRRFECLALANGSVIETDSMAEALFWQLLGYFVRQAAPRA